MLNRNDDQAGRAARIRVAEILGSIAEMAVAVSGGVDSLALAVLAHRVAGPRVTMFHAVSPAVPEEATRRVERIGEQENWRLTIMSAGEFADPAYRRNPVNRCYFCKTNLYGAIAQRTGAQILSGANQDDLGEYRPGLDAAGEHGVRHPYLEAGIDKRTVRALARELGLGDLADLPAAPCLSSRVETGIAISPDALRAIHAAERLVAGRIGGHTVRCRLRAAGIVVELDAPSLAALDADSRAMLGREVGGLFGDLAPTAGITFEPYRNGSAFLRSRP
jgi:uncharacterized protein